MENIRIKHFLIGKGQPLAVISGPCVIESELHCLKAAETLKKIFSKRNFHLIFKSSYDKANRLSIDSFRGPGLEEGLRILEKVKNELDLPILTDVHTPEEARAAGAICDIIQIPAFLCRQTDLIIAAAQTSAAINIKKGQFLAPWDMKSIVEKATSSGHKRLILTDRGVTFGYNNLVSDMRSIPIMQQFGFPVCFDASHSVQLPGGLGGSSGGQREFIPTLSKAAIAAGCNSLFIEAHPSPSHAKSDAASVIDFKDLPLLLWQFEQIYEAVHQPLPAEELINP